MVARSAMASQRARLVAPGTTREGSDHDAVAASWSWWTEHVEAGRRPVDQGYRLGNRAARRLLPRPHQEQRRGFGPAVADTGAGDLRGDCCHPATGNHQSEISEATGHRG